MPSVPSYGDLKVVPGVGGAARFNGVDPAAAAAPGVAMQRAGRAAMDTAAQLQEIAQQRAREQDEAAVRELDTELSGRLRGVLNDPRTGYLNTTGKAAVEAEGATLEALETAFRETSERAANPAQRAMLGRVLAARRESALDRLGAHAARETKTYAADTAGSRLDAAIQDGAASYVDEGARRLALGVALGEADKIAQLKGLDDVGRQGLRLKAGAQFHGAVIDRLDNDDPRAAMAYLQANRAGMDEQSAARLEDALRPRVLDAEAAAIADRVRGVAGQDVKNSPRDADLNGLLAAVDKMGLSPELAERAKAKVEAGVRQDQQLLADVQRRASDYAWDMYDRGGSVPPRVLASMSPDARHSLTRTLRADAERAAGGAEGSGPRGTKSGKSDPETRLSLREMQVDDPEGFAKYDLNQVRGELSAADFERFKVAQARENRKGEDAPDKVTLDMSVRTARQVLPRIGIPVGNSKAAMKPENVAKVDAFEQALDDRARAWARQNKRVPNSDDMRALADGLLIETVTPTAGGLFSPSERRQRVFELGGKAPAGVSVQVPASARARIVDSLRVAGKPVTSDNIARAYMGERIP